MQARLCGFSLAVAPNEACYVPTGHRDGGEGGGNDADHDGGGGKAYVAELTEMFEDLIDGINDGEGGGHGNTGSGGGGGIDAGLFGDIGDLANAEDFGHPHSGLFQVDDLLM